MVKRPARWFAALAILFAVAALYLSGALAPLDRLLLDWRFRLLERPASGGVVVVEIDARSLRELDLWPWPRTYHADVLDRLVEAGASEVALDIDFSTRSTEDGDRDLAGALRRAGSRVILPAFRQVLSRGPTGSEIFDTLPRSAFSEVTQIGNASVVPSSDGLVRDISDMEVIDGVSYPSIFALLAGPDAIVGRRFTIDFGIDPRSIPRLSYVDVLRGDFQADLVAGRKVIVGATATDLGDMLAVPVYRSMAGPVLQAMAYESLVQGRAIRTPAPGAAVLVALLLLLVVTPRFATRSWRRSLAIGGLAIAGLELGALGLQAVLPLALPTTPWIVTIVLSFMVAMARRVEAQAREILAQRQTIVTRRALMDCMVENSFDGIVITDSDGRIEVFNEAAGEMLERRTEDAIGRPLDQLLPGAIQFAAEFDILAADGALPNHIGPEEWGLVRADGTTTQIELIVGRAHLDVGGRGRRDATREQTFHTFTFRDISERKQAQEAERRATEEALAASRAKTEFLANMSHELRTPLNAIIGFSDTMRAETFGPIGSPRYAQYIEDISQSGSHLLAIINDILDVSRIELGRFRLDKEQLDPRALLQSCVRIPGWANFPNREFEADLPDDLPHIHGDARVIKQIVINLLSNAFKYSRSGDRIRLQARADVPDGLIITVSDTGIGIAAELLRDLTKPFFQVDGSLQRSREGTGLGLYITSSLVELHGGELRIESEPEVGTTVTVRLRCAEESAGQAATPGLRTAAG